MMREINLNYECKELMITIRRIRRELPFLLIMKETEIFRNSTMILMPQAIQPLLLNT